MARGSFNTVLYGAQGERQIVRRRTLAEARRIAEEHAQAQEGNYASVVRVSDGRNVGLALRGVFQFV
jgi:hypothetical protein